MESQCLRARKYPDALNCVPQFVRRWQRYIWMLVALIVANAYALPACARENDDLTQPLRVSTDGHFIVQPDGSPFFWLGDTAWAIFARLTRDEADLYLKDRAAKGFNVIQAVAIGGPFDALDAPNRYGELALTRMEPSRPNPKYFEHIDWVVDRARQYGVRFAILPVWGSSLVGGYASKEPIFTPATARTYGEWIARRYRGKGVIWVLGGDTNPVWPEGMDFLAAIEGSTAIQAKMPVLKDYRPIYDAMAEGLIHGDGGDPLITYHPTPISYSGAARPLTSLYLGDRPWLDMNMLQSGHHETPAIEIFPSLRSDFSLIGPRNYEAICEEYNSRPTRPVIDGEPRYEGLPIDLKWDPKKGSWRAYDARNAAYHAVFAGAAGHTFGNASVHLSWDPAIRQGDLRIGKNYPELGGTWREQLNSQGAREMQHLKALMLSRPYFTRVPDQSIIVGDPGEGEHHVSATRSNDGAYVMVYAPFGRQLTVDMSKISGKHAVAWWFDPRTGKPTRLNGVYRTRGTRQFTPPTAGRENDWVLVLDDDIANFCEPGRCNLGEVPQVQRAHSSARDSD